MARYNAHMMPALVKGLKTKGYLPRPEHIALERPLARAPYRFSLEVNEQQEGNYMASENRLTRIDARLKLLKNGIEIWNTTPTARTRVPLPNLPATSQPEWPSPPPGSRSSSVCSTMTPASQIDEKFAFALSHMPECVQAGSSRHQ